MSKKVSANPRTTITLFERTLGECSSFPRPHSPIVRCAQHCDQFVVHVCSFGTKAFKFIEPPSRRVVAEIGVCRDTSEERVQVDRRFFHSAIVYDSASCQGQQNLLSNKPWQLHCL